MGLFFGRRRQQQPVVRMDGYKDRDVPTILWFQKEYETTHIDAVKAGLRAARDPNFVITKQSLMRFIQNEDWAMAGGMYQ